MPFISYHSFRLLADGMLLTMVLYGLIKLLVHKDTFYILYQLFLITALISFRIHDESYNLGNYEIADDYGTDFETFAGLFLLLFCEHIADLPIGAFWIKKFFHIFKIFLLTSIMIEVSLKQLHFTHLVTTFYLIERFVSMLAILILTYEIYKIKVNFIRYYIIGINVFVLLYTYKLIGLSIPNFFSYDEQNMFTFPNTYHELSLIIESCFFIMGFSAYNNFIEIEKKELQTRLMQGLEDKNANQKHLLEMQTEVKKKIEHEIESNLIEIIAFVRQTYKLIPLEKQKAKENALLICQLASQAISNTRAIVRELDSKSTKNDSIKQKFHQITAKLCQTNEIQFDLFLNETPYWINMNALDGEKIYNFYNNLLSSLISNKTINQLIINLSITEDALVRIIIQDDGGDFITKNHLEKTLSKIHYQIEIINGMSWHFTEQNNQTTIRTDISIFETKPEKPVNYPIFKKCSQIIQKLLPIFAFHLMILRLFSNNNFIPLIT